MKCEKTITRYVPWHMPIIEIENITIREQYMKLREELDEFQQELDLHADHDRILHELQDVVQAYITLMVLEAKKTEQENAVDMVVETLVEANQDHRKKIERYKAERGWT